MANELIGIIGGSGLYRMEGVRISGEKRVVTPFGEASDALLLGTLGDREVVFLPRHGRGHRILPHEINYRANIYAMKEMGVETIVSVSAVGSLREDIHPGELVIVDQFVDRTKVRDQSFFGEGLAVHAAFADPVCGHLRGALVAAAKKSGAAVHDGGTYICIEGPMFSSKAESNLYRSWGMDVIGMTNYTEAKLAREAEICYATIALATDYDCWHEEEGPVDVAQVVRILQENVTKAQKTIGALLPDYAPDADCPCRHALKDAIITDRRAIDDDTKNRLRPIIGKYL